MSEWKQKRFWKTVAVVPQDSGYTVELDKRRIKTPAKAGLIVPTQDLAEAIAIEWDAQEDLVKPDTMPFTRTANAAIDKVAIQHGEVADMLAAYGDADLLCYRAEGPEGLIARQAERWDPALDWAAEHLNARLEPRSGLMHAPQDASVLGELSHRVHALSNFQLAAFHDLVSLSGSLVLGFAAALDWRSADEIWSLSRVDEDWQSEQWGKDDEAEAQAEIKHSAFLHAKRVCDLC